MGSPPTTSPPVAAPTPDGVPALPAAISIDMYKLEFDFAPQLGCVHTDDLMDLMRRPRGASANQCAQACAALASCTGIVEFWDGDAAGQCALSMPVELNEEVCEDTETYTCMWYYDRDVVLQFD